MKIVKTIVFSLFALMFINAGLDKFFHYMPMPPMEGEMKKVFDAFITLKWLMPLTGFGELLGGLLILFPKTRALGSVVIFPVMIGILAHLITFMPSGLMISAPLFIINLWMIGDNWAKIKPLFS